MFFAQLGSACNKYQIISLFGLNYFGDSPLVMEKDFGGVALFRNDNAFPRAFLTSSYEVISDRKDIYPRIYSGVENLREKVFLEKEPALPIAPGNTPPGSVDISSYAIDSVVVNIQNGRDALLVLTDNYYFAWDAYVDGAKSEVLRADGSFRAVPVPGGTRQVIFKYNRSLNNRAKMVTYLTLLLVAAVVGVEIFNSSRAKRKAARTA